MSDQEQVESSEQVYEHPLSIKKAIFGVVIVVICIVLVLFWRKTASHQVNLPQTGKQEPALLLKVKSFTPKDKKPHANLTATPNLCKKDSQLVAVQTRRSFATKASLLVLSLGLVGALAYYAFEYHKKCQEEEIIQGEEALKLKLEAERERQREEERIRAIEKKEQEAKELQERKLKLRNEITSTYQKFAQVYKNIEPYDLKYAGRIKKCDYQLITNGQQTKESEYIVPKESMFDLNARLNTKHQEDLFVYHDDMDSINIDKANYLNNYKVRSIKSLLAVDDVEELERTEKLIKRYYDASRSYELVLNGLTMFSSKGYYLKKN